MTTNKLNGAGISTPSNSSSNRGEKQAFKIDIIDNKNQIHKLNCINCNTNKFLFRNATVPLKKSDQLIIPFLLNLLFDNPILSGGSYQKELLTKEINKQKGGYIPPLYHLAPFVELFQKRVVLFKCQNCGNIEWFTGTVNFNIK